MEKTNEYVIAAYVIAIAVLILYVAILELVRKNYCDKNENQ